MYLQKNLLLLDSFHIVEIVCKLSHDVTFRGLLLIYKIMKNKIVNPLSIHHKRRFAIPTLVVKNLDTSKGTLNPDNSTQSRRMRVYPKY